MGNEYKILIDQLYNNREFNTSEVFTYYSNDYIISEKFIEYLNNRIVIVDPISPNDFSVVGFNKDKIYSTFKPDLRDYLNESINIVELAKLIFNVKVC